MQIVDIQGDLGEERRRRRGLLLRYGLSIASVLLIVGGLIGATLFTRSMNERDVLSFSSEFIRILDDRVDSEVRSYLEPAQSSVQLLSSALPADPFSEEGQAVFEHLAREVLRRQPQIGSIYVGSDGGQFLLVRRNDAGSLDSKIITRRDGEREVLWYRRDEGGETKTIERTPEDNYDPRERGWFQGALAQEEVFWSDVYVFFTDKVPGITAAKAAPEAAGGQALVVGADISLDNLGGFLGSLQREARGKLAIIDADGKFIAYSEGETVVVDTSGAPRTQHISEIEDRVLAEAFDRVRILGRGQTSVSIDGTSYLLAASSLEGAVGRNWLLIMLAPERAFIGFIAANSRRGLLASGFVVLMAVLLAGFLAYQGYLAERNMRRLRREREELNRQSDAFEELSSLPAFAADQDAKSLRRAMELMTEISGAQRASLWRLSPRRKELIAAAIYDAESKGHTSGVILRGDDFPAFFAELEKGEELVLKSAGADPRATALHITYLRPVGVTGLISHPVRQNKKTVGALWLEYRREPPEEEAGSSFAQTLANLAAPLVAELEEEQGADHSQQEIARGSAAVAAPSELRGARLCDNRAILLEKRLKQQGAAGAISFKGTTVLALKFLDDTSLAAPLKGDDSSLLIKRVVTAFQEAADDLGVPYLKILTDQIIAVDGLEGEESLAAHRLMRLALKMQGTCSSLFLELGRGPQYSFGLDTGPTMGSHVGFGQSPYNIWGEAVRIALSLANSAQAGSIQVSEATYELLREDYIFRKRGSYYLERIGEMTTFTLRGHL
jgi:class 3 adenylate cyclase